MLSIVTKGIKEVEKAIKKDAKQMRFAAAVALTRTAKIAAGDEKKLAAKKLVKPTPFTLRGFRFKKATKAKLESSVYIAPIQAEYLWWSVEGGRRAKRAKSGEALPVNIKLNQYGNIPARGKGKIKKLIDRPDTFLGTVRGVYGLWQRGSQKNKIKLLLRFVPSTKYHRRFKFYDLAERAFKRHFGREFDKAFDEAIRTAR